MRFGATRGGRGLVAATFALVQSVCAADGIAQFTPPDLIDRVPTAVAAPKPQDTRSDGRPEGRTEAHTEASDGSAEALARGEAAYRSGRFDDAVASFERRVAANPDDVHAWLRLGNVHHQRRDWFKALAAYRRVAARRSGDGTDPALRAKALYNVALINLELARQTLGTLERMGPVANVAGRREPLSNAIENTRRRLESFAPAKESPTRGRNAGDSDNGGTSPGASSTSPGTATVLAPAPEPRGARAPASARRGQTSAARASGEGHSRGQTANERDGRDNVDDVLPRVDYIRGDPRP